MHATYGDKVQFYFVYCREAHAADSDRPNSAEVEQPVSTQERREVAAAFLDDMDLKISALLDNIDDKTSRDYASHPDRMYLIDVNGRIAYAGEKGPRGFKPDELEQAIKQELSSPGGLARANKKPNAARSPNTEGRQSQRATRIMSMPLISAINKDGDDKISQSEIDDATEALKTLDRNGDGKLTPDELLPQRRRR